MFSSEYYSKLDPTYRKALRQLESELEEPQNDHAQNASTYVIKRYMLPQELWNLVPDVNRCFDENCSYHIKDYSALYSFFYKDYKFNGQKRYDRDNFNGLAGYEDLSFPHQHLDKKMEEHERQSYSFIPRDVRQLYVEMKALYWKIKAAEGDLDEWFAAMMEAKDHQFVKENVEYRLGKDLTDKKLWMKYIDYLKEHDFELLLETYSKCIRFFTDDMEIMDGYRQAAIQFGRRVFVPWINPCSLEVYDSTFFNSGHIDHRADRKAQNLPPEKEPLTIHFDGQNATKPQFPFLSPTIRYILDNASGEVLQKLFKTCKWFRVAKSVNVCYKFHEDNSRRNQPIEIKEQSILSVENSVLRSNLDQLFISTVFYYSNANRSALSKLISKIYRCSAKYVHIQNQNLLLEELQFLIGNGVDLQLFNVCESDGKEFKLEYILQLTPKVKRLVLRSVECTSETAHKLCELEFQNKLDYIYLSDVKIKLLDPVKFAEFIKKNCSSKAEIVFFVRREGRNVEYITRFRQVLDDAIKEKWDGNEKPKVSIH